MKSTPKLEKSPLSLVLGGAAIEREKRLLGLTKTGMGEGFGGVRCELVWEGTVVKILGSV